MVLSGLQSLADSATQDGAVSLLGANASAFSFAQLDKQQGVLTLTLAAPCPASAPLRVHFDVVNPVEPQGAQATYLQCADALATTLQEQTDAGLDRAAPLLVVDFALKDIAQSSPWPSAINTLTVTFSVTAGAGVRDSVRSAWAGMTTNVSTPSSMLVLAVRGLVKTDTQDAAPFLDLVPHNTPVHSALWVAASGALYLRLNDTLQADEPYWFSFRLRNIRSAQSPAEPTIALGRLGHAPAAFSTAALLPRVDMLGAAESLAPLKVFANFTVLRLGQTSASAAADNMLSLTIASNNGLHFDPSIRLTLAGLHGSTSASGAIAVNSSHSTAAMAEWNRSRGSLVYSFPGNLTLAQDQELVLSFTLRNPSRPQQSPAVSLWASEVLPRWVRVDRAPGLQAPLAVAGVVTAHLSQSSSSQGEPNTVTLSVQFQTGLPEDSAEFLVLSGLTGTATADSSALPVSVSVANYSASPQIQGGVPWNSSALVWTNLSGARSPFSEAGAWNQSEGKLRLQLRPALLEGLASYAIRFTLDNPAAGQSSPPHIQVWGEGDVTMAPTAPGRAAGRRAPLVVAGFQLKQLAQSEASVSKRNTLTLTLACAFAPIRRESRITLAGLVGAVPGVCAAAGAEECELDTVAVTVRQANASDHHRHSLSLSERAAWRSNASSATLVLHALSDIAPGAVHVIELDLVNGAHAQPRARVYVSACCTTVLVPAVVDPAAGNAAPLLIAGSSVAVMAQGSPGQGQDNTLSASMSFNVRLQPVTLAMPAPSAPAPAQHIRISGLVGSATRSSHALAVNCSGGKLGRAHWTASSGRLTLAVVQVIEAEELVQCNFTLRNPRMPQDAPAVSIALLATAAAGAISGAHARVTSPPGVNFTLQPDRQPLFVHGWLLASIRQATPSADALNTLTVSLQSLGTLANSTAITLLGLHGAATPATALLPLADPRHNASAPPSPFAARAAWDPVNGSLVVGLRDVLPARRTVSLSFQVRNPRGGQDPAAARAGVEGLILPTAMATGAGNAAVLLVADLLERRLGQSEPAQGARNTLSLTLAARARIGE